MIPADVAQAAALRSRDAARRWHALPANQRLRAMLGDAARDPTRLRADIAVLFDDIGWIDALIAPLIAALADDPLFEPPFKVQREPGRLGALIHDGPAGRVGVNIVAASAVPRAPASVVMTGHVAVTRYLRAPGAVVRRWRLAAGRMVEMAPVAPAAGDIVECDGREVAQTLCAAAGDVVTLTAILRAGAAPLMHEYAVPSGERLRTASTDDGVSRSAMLLAMLRAAGRADAGPSFDAATRAPAFHLRWSAMREWLALDARAATPRLAEMAADDPDDGVRRAAAATLVVVRERIAACPA